MSREDEILRLCVKFNINDKLFIQNSLLYFSELEKWGKVMSLIGKVNFTFFLEQLEDVLNGFAIIKQFSVSKDSIIDLGAGNGIVGIPLSMFLPDRNLTMLELKIKKCAFLNSVISLIQSKNASVLCNDFKKLDAKFDVAVCKAFMPINDKFAILVKSILKEGGKFFAYVSHGEKIIKNLSNSGFKTHLHRLNSNKNRAILQMDF